MALHPAVLLWLTSILFSTWCHALQVTPGSPCTDLCIDDSQGSHKGDSKLSDITGDDIVCNDFEFSSDKAGKAFQRCMTCLQGSDFAKGAESDLDWFLYNLRYSFDYCVFGDPQSKEIDSNPCATSEGCGSLTDALRKGMVNSTDREQYGYCEVDEQAIKGEDFDQCLSCVSAESTHSYLSNFLIALAIGCDQRPSPGHLLGLNETVFTKNTIQAVNPNDLDAQTANGLILPLPAIVGIAVGGLVLLLLALGCGYMHHRRRKNRQRASGWSFRCQAASGSLPPRSVRDDEKLEMYTTTAPSESRVTGLFPAPPASTMSDSKHSSSAKDNVTAIVTAIPPHPPLQTSGRSFHGSPVYDDHITPSSATSTRSTRPLLRHGTSPQSSSTPVWDELQQQRMFSGPRPLTGSPAATMRNFSSTFPPPPPRR
ncbi:LPXTG-domain-containing protein [Sarocladium implicatum]|nr:LPXTG-domain-containing protein [Sarocladium implicatum]